MKVVINRCYGGFGLSEAAVRRYFEIKNQPVWVEPGKWFSNYWLVPAEERITPLEGEAFYALTQEERIAHNHTISEQTFCDYRADRADPDLIQAVEELGDKANGPHAELAVIEIPDDVDWEIDDYDGMERVVEKHRSWC